MTRPRLLALLGAFALVVVGAAIAKPFPGVIELPDGWRPEGIEAGRGTTFFVGSIPTGAIRQVDARTGSSFTLVPGETGRAAIGLEYDVRTNRLFVAGGPTGSAFVYDAGSGALVASYVLTPSGPTFINDAVLTRDAVYFTDSQQPTLYRLPLGPGGSLPDASAIEAIPLSGDYVHGSGNNLNGIVATADGKTLIAVQSNAAALHVIDPETGIADQIEVDGDAATNGDGLLLEGTTLYVVQNRLNRVAVVELADDLGSGVVTEYLTHPEFEVPTTIDRIAGRLYLPNAKFGIANPDAAEYEVVGLGTAR